MTYKRIEVTRGIDELGEPEELTWDLLPVVDSLLTAHLDENGLPKKGTTITPGMVLVGKIGKSRSHDPAKQPTALEIESLDFAELSSRYASMWQNTSCYATSDDAGTVSDAWIEESEPTKAVVIVELHQQ
ncbi:MAG TPA: hypothetical protein VGJ26_00915 [Pirellulales bacterium]|jgi:DNA-directed RNA polymerase beta subunit